MNEDNNYYWNIERNVGKLIARKSISYDYCVDCQKPLRRFNIRCTTCVRKLIYKSYIPIKEVGLSVVNYQYHMTKQFFNYVPNAKYRGLKPDRIVPNLTPDIINKYSTKIDKILLSRNNSYIDMYKKLKIVKPNITKIILYNITLSYLAYYKESNGIFASEASFMSTVTTYIHRDIRKQYIKHFKEIPDYRLEKLGTKYLYRLIEKIDDVMGEFIGFV